ncbi:MAG: hypothetical protein RR435_04430 [Erysipelotrichaceae bacterium]
MKKYCAKFELLDFILVFMSVLLKYLKFVFSINPMFMNIYFAILVLICIVKLNGMTFKKKIVMRIFVVFVFSAFATFVANSLDFVMPFLFALIFMKKDFKQYLFYLLISSAICFSSVIILSNLNIISSHELNRIVDNDITVRTSLGFEHVNAAFLHYFIILTLWYILFDNNMKFYIFNIIIIMFLMQKTLCRTGFYCSIIFLVLTFIKSRYFEKFILMFTKYIFPVFSFISFYIAINYSVYNVSFNNALSQRPLYWNYCFEHLNQFSLIGNEINLNVTIDNMFINIYFSYGIIVFLMFLVVYVYGLKNIRDYKMCLVMITFGIYGLFESNHFYYLNYTLFIIFGYLINSNINFKRYKNSNRIMNKT